MLPTIAKITSMCSGVVRILGMNPSPYTLQGTNSYMIGTESSPHRLLIDTSSPNTPDYIDNIRDYFETNPNSFISDIIITHWHQDHIGSVPDLLEFSRINKWPSIPRIHKYPSTTYQYEGPICDLSHNQIFQLSNYGLSSDRILRVLYTPGHTDDHVCLEMTGGKSAHSILFCGDLILGHGSSVFENLRLYMDSLEKTKLAASQYVRIYSGHGCEIENPVEKVNEYITHRQNRIDQVINALKLASKSDWLSELDLIGQIYEPEILAQTSLKYGALNNLKLILEYLYENGLVDQQHNSDNVVWRLK